MVVVMTAILEDIKSEDIDPQIGGFVGSVGGQSGLSCCLEGSLVKIRQGQLTHYAVDKATQLETKRAHGPGKVPIIL